MTGTGEGGGRRRRPRGVLRHLGTLLMVVGALGILWGVAIWQWGDPVTALYTRWEQRQLADEYERVEREFAEVLGTVRPTKPGRKPRPPSPVVIRRAATVFHDRADAGDPLGRIRVPKLDLDMVLVAGTDAGSLRKGPGWDQRTFLPGEGELVYIAGHRTTFQAPFGHIDRLDPGDRVELDLPYGRFTYRVTQSVIVPATDVGRLRSRGREEIALQACHPRFSAKERYIVYARPVGVRAPDGATR